MRAWLNNGKGLGSDNSSITNEYKSIPNMYKYGIKPFVNKHGYCKAEIHFNWDTRYGIPNKILIYSIVNGVILCESHPIPKN